MGDIIFFQKVENDLASKWTLGRIDDVNRSADGHVRRVVIEYRNAKEEVSRYTDRAARTVIKLFHLDDTNWRDDMAEVERLRQALLESDQIEEANLNAANVVHPVRDEITRERLDAVGGYDERLREIPR